MRLLIDLILVGVGLEAVGLFAFGQRLGRRGFGRAMLANLAAGGFLLLGVRLALGGVWWGWICASLLGGLVAHVVDLRGRWAT